MALYKISGQIAAEYWYTSHQSTNTFRSSDAYSSAFFNIKTNQLLAHRHDLDFCSAQSLPLGPSIRETLADITKRLLPGRRCEVSGTVSSTKGSRACPLPLGS